MEDTRPINRIGLIPARMLNSQSGPVSSESGVHCVDCKKRMQTSVRTTCEKFVVYRCQACWRLYEMNEAKLAEKNVEIGKAWCGTDS